MKGQASFTPDGLVGCPTHRDELRETAERIKDRDRRLLEGARLLWLETGQDLIRAKKLLGHGRFEKWCANELSYSKSKAEKLMRAAEVFGPHLKSVTVTDLPPPTVLYALSAPSVPQELRDQFIPRIVAGEQVGSEVRRAIKRHRENVELEERRAVPSCDADIEDEARARARADVEREGQQADRSAALKLILARVGDDLPKLLALVVKAGPNSVFMPTAYHELLRQIAKKFSGPAIREDDIVAFNDGGTSAPFRGPPRKFRAASRDRSAAGSGFSPLDEL
jgi:hypothetical protein